MFGSKIYIFILQDKADNRTLLSVVSDSGRSAERKFLNLCKIHRIFNKYSYYTFYTAMNYKTYENNRNRGFTW